MGFVEANKTCFAKYFTLSGRASRSEYWQFALGLAIIGSASAVIDGFAFGFRADPGPIELLFDFLIICPILTAFVRRLHDTGKSGWYFFAPPVGCAIVFGIGAAMGTSIGKSIIWVVGAMILAVLLLPLWWSVQPSQPGPNKYGPNPIEVTP